MFIDEYYLNLTNLEKEILNTIYKIPNEFVHLKIQDFAKKLHTNSSTISKLIKKIGFNSYKEFQTNFKIEFNSRNIITKDFEKIKLDLIYSLKQIVNTIEKYSTDYFEDISNIILESTKIITVGFGNSLIAANEMFQSLSRLGLNSYCTNDIFGNLTLFENLDSNSIILFYSHMFSSRTVFRAYELLNALNIRIILISSNNKIDKSFNFFKTIFYKANNMVNTSFLSKINMISINFILKDLIKTKIENKHIKDKSSFFI